MMSLDKFNSYAFLFLILYVALRFLWRVLWAPRDRSISRIQRWWRGGW
jgi:hypothetical protein